MKNEKRSILILFIYVVLMVAVCTFAVISLKKANTAVVPQDSVGTTVETVFSTEIIYIPIYTESEQASTTEIIDLPVKRYKIKSYEGKIGVFDDNGALLEVIEVYTKTLPKADRRMLEEGIIVHSESELHSIIEDYTG